MKVSVIVPIFNMEEYLPLCIESILRQTYPILEIILIDDGSSDSSLSICTDYQTGNKCIKVIHQDNQGVSTARNQGICAASGDFICFIDPDDWVDPDYIVTLVEKRNDSDLVIGGYKVVGMDGYLPGNKTTFPSKIYLLDDFYRCFSYFRNNSSCSSILSSPINKLYKLDIIRSNWLYFDKDISLGEDYLFNLKYFAFCRQITIISETYYNYLIRPYSLSRGMTYKTAISQIILYDETEKYIKKYLLPLKANCNIVQYKFFLFNYIVITVGRSLSISYDEKKHIIKEIKGRIRFVDFLAEKKGSVKQVVFEILVCISPLWLILLFLQGSNNVKTTK